MGITTSIIYDHYFNDKKKIILVGLPNSGKKTILKKIGAKLMPSVPLNTQNWHVKEYLYQNLIINSWMVTKYYTNKIRNLFRPYYNDVNGIVFVIDSSDKGKLEEAREEIRNLLNEELLQNAFLVVLANKSDILNTNDELVTILGLNIISDHKWKLMFISAELGTGIKESIDCIQKFCI